MSLIPRTDRSIVFGPVNNRLLYLGTNFSALVPSCGSDKGVNILDSDIHLFGTPCVENETCSGHVTFYGQFDENHEYHVTNVTQCIITAKMYVAPGAGIGARLISSNDRTSSS